jgi:hypothetical protein
MNVITEDKVFLVYLDHNPNAFMVHLGQGMELSAVREKMCLKLKMQEGFTLSFLLNDAIVTVVDGKRSH